MPALTPSAKELYSLITSFFVQSPGCSLKLQAPGTSMTPFIRHDSLLTLKPLSKTKPPKTGDVVLAAVHSCQKILIHRIIAQKGNTYLLKGDNTRSCDGWFQREDLLACVTRIECNGKLHTPGPMTNRLIAAASRTGFLNRILLPAARGMKQQVHAHL